MAASIARLNSKISTHYYAKDNYYTKEDGLETSSWFGRGASFLKLKGCVEEESFKNLMEGKNPSGENYLGPKPRERVLKKDETGVVKQNRSGVDCST